MSRISLVLTAFGFAGVLSLIAGEAQSAIVDGDVITISQSGTKVGGGADATSNAYGNQDPTYGGSLYGGEFRVYEKPDGLLLPDGEYFKTFCIEYSEHISLNGNYLASIENGAILGGKSGAGTGANAYIDYLSGATQWIYRAYRTNSLDDFTGFQYDNAKWGDALQLVFWRLEGELTSTPSNPWEYTTDSTITSKADAIWNFYQNNLWLDTYVDSTVKVLNLWTTNADDGSNPLANAANYAKLDTDATFRGSLSGYKAQSQLYYSGPSDAPPVLPEPTSLLVWSGLAGLGFVAARRRSTSKQVA